jgi:nitrogen fixation protein FixH
MMRRFTGWHMATIMIAFFGVVIAVNLVMATFAVRTFGGLVVDNSYVASQDYNGWLARARRQAELGWNSEMTLSDSRHVEVRISSPRETLSAARVTGVATHPLGRAPDQNLDFERAGENQYRSRQALPPGRWHVLVSVRSGSREARFVKELAK